MESEAVRPGRRGRKRRRPDLQNDLVDQQAKKQTRSKALVGRYVKKEFKGSGIFLGKIVSYDAGLYRIDYEDGDCEDMGTSEVKGFLVEEGDFDNGLIPRKEKLDETIARKGAKPEDIIVERNVVASVNALEHEVSSLNGLHNEVEDEIDSSQIDGGADSSSDSCEHARDPELCSEVDAPAIPPPELPPSSGNIGVPEEYVSHLFSVYIFLRSFSIPLFLSPFTLDDFVGSLNCSAPSTLLDAIHVALMRALRRHLEAISSDGSELASKSLRFIDWNLLDTLTWPVYLVQYLMVMGYANGPEWKGFYTDTLEKDYYALPVGRKLMILQILCDNVLDSEELRAEIDMREELEVGIDSDAVAAIVSDSWPRRVHPRYSKTSACKNEEVMEIIADAHRTNSQYNSSSLGAKTTHLVADGDTNDGNGDECRLCGMDGTLLCCDGCPSAYHSRCIGVSKMSIPEGAWYCHECTLNKIGPTITSNASLKGAEVFGVDSYGQVFLGTCGHLLVLKVSMNLEQCLKYYYQNDIPKVLRALLSSVQHFELYSEIVNKILQYWDIKGDILQVVEANEMGKRSANLKQETEPSTPLLAPMGKDDHNIRKIYEGDNLASCVTESSGENVIVFGPENSCKEPVCNNNLMDRMTNMEHLPRPNDDATRNDLCHFNHTELIELMKVDSTISSGSVSQQADPSDMTHRSFIEKSGVIEFATCTSGNSNGSHKLHAKAVWATVNMSLQSKEISAQVDRNNPSDNCVYMGSNFKPHTYINHYIHGDFAASAAANLAVLSSEENRVSETHALENRRKVMSANISLQVKAFSSAAIRFFWPNYEKKLVEVPRERCGWCLSCKAPATSKRGCLLNAAASNAIKGAMKVLAGLRHVKNGEGSLASIAMYVMFMEESLCGLTVGPFQRSAYRNQWRKQAEQATSYTAIKTLLLELEENIRVVALSADWIKLVDNSPTESSATQIATCAAGSTQRRGRRGRKPSIVSEGDSLDDLSDFHWWRGGMFSKLVLQKGALPHSMVKKAARQGGRRKISGLYYAEGHEIPKRSRRFIWRAGVEMSKNASQLAIQVRYLDSHVRWSDLVRPEQNLQDGKGPETEASAFRNAFVCGKKIVEDKIIYGVAFGSQKHLPSRVMKSIIEVEQEDGKEKYWFSETRVPLYLIKEYEEKLEKEHLSSIEKPVKKLSELQRKQLKVSRKDIFSYLSCKRDNLEMCFCASCQLDVLLRNAVMCCDCQGFCHEQCTVISTVNRNQEIESLIACKKCRPPKAFHQIELSNDSPTSPLLLQRQEFPIAGTASKSVPQKTYNQPLPPAVHVQSPSEMKPATRDSSSTTKSQRKHGSWGLIWRKKNTEDNGIDFRLKNILLRGNRDMSWSPVCHLCHKAYNSDLMYIRCETCNNWYHAEALELQESRIFDLVGFKCCRCRRIKSPVCPYLDPSMKKALEAKKPRKRPPKAGNSVVDPDDATIPEQPREREPSTPALPINEGFLCAKEEDPLLFSTSRVEQFTEHNPGRDFEWNPAAASGPGPQKLPVRRHLKREPNIDGTSGDNPSEAELSTPIGSNITLDLKDESLNPGLEWDISNNGLEDGILFDYEGLNYEDMEFEPQTYFSFTELLASDDGGQVDEVDASGDLPCNWENSSAVPHDVLMEQCGGGTDSPNEPMISVEPVLCHICSRMEPYPDLSCQICGLWIHSHCSPWVDEPSTMDNWRCGQCREWR
ncbi:hypothetical protein NMG60_11033325 [Bertholletia excelsa]